MNVPCISLLLFFFSSRRRHTRLVSDWSSDVCSSDLVNAAAGGYKGAAVTRLYEDLLSRISTVPGLRGVTVSHNGLFSHQESADPIAVEGYTPKSGEEMDSRIDHVGPGYFSTMGNPILLGSELGAHDRAAGLRPAVVNETFAHR